ncbi:MAG: tRNA 4-thiouridine(8) synthase ThiI [Clostridiales bacterium]|nr:tRNA 4-thiouridine(8) synthase ThiI [Clostridiales bacterium]
MKELLLVRFGEIHLKGLNRPYFMRLLTNRIKQAIQGQQARVWIHDGRIFVSDMLDQAYCIEKISKVFGVHSLCPAIEMEKTDFAAVTHQAVKMMEGKKGTFKVVARRSDKHYPLTSPQINQEVGAAILKAYPNLQVDVHTPDHVCSIEIRSMAYIYTQVIPAVGGMPVGSNGKATLLLSGGIDSPVAGWMVAKRGVSISGVYFHSFPYTSDRAKEKVLDLARKLSESCCGIRVYVVPFTDLQLAIHEQCPPEYSTVIMRRYMMKIAERIALKEKSLALITGESIGQVASQTLQALYCTDSAVTLPVFRPLIGMDKQEIIDKAVQIDTYETSSLPYEDCCTVFTPKHPATKPDLAKVEKAEEVIDGESFIQDALENIEIVDV